MIPTEDFTDETLATDDTIGDGVEGGDWGDGDVDKMADETCLKWGPELPFICLNFSQKSLSKCRGERIVF